MTSAFRSDNFLVREPAKQHSCQPYKERYFLTGPATFFRGICTKQANFTRWCLTYLWKRRQSKWPFF